MPEKFEISPTRIARRLAFVLVAIVASLGASEPEIVRVRVAASKVSAWFPPGTELEILSPQQFEDRLKLIRDRPSPEKPPRLLRARHKARLQAGALIGKSELTLELPTGPGSSLLPLEPWSPALDQFEWNLKFARATADGRLAVKVDAKGPSTVDLNWRLEARPGSEGRVFSLALPELEVASLALDLPVGWVPDAKAGPCVGPEPDHEEPGRAIWCLEAARGTIDLRFRNPAEDAARPDGPRLWLEGPTRVDLNQAPANWRAEWMLDESPGAARQLTIELDPNLDLIDVLGPRVAAFREEPAGDSTRVAIKLDGEGSGPSPLTIRANCRVPTSGPWVVPSARPIDAVWTGGRTLVLLDSTRVLESCAERSGRRVPPRPGDPTEPSTLIFEGNGEPGPVAELKLREPTADATLDIRGHLLLGDEVPRFDAALTWSVERGRLLTHSVELSPGWTPDRVLSSVRQPVPWHADRLSNGRTRVIIGPSVDDENALLLTLTLSASAWKAGVTGPLDLPRVRPSPGVRVVDEIWAATPDPRLALRPIKGEGLAWIDPLDPPLDDAPAPWVAEDLRNALAWRWLADGAEGRINRMLPADRPIAEVSLDATIARGRLGLNWSLEIESDLGDLRSIPIHLDETLGAPIHWRSRDAGGPIVETKPIDEARRAKLGFPATGSAWSLDLLGTARGRVQLEGSIDRPWSGQGKIPILNLPDQFRTRGLLRLSVDDPTRLTIDAKGLTPIDPSAVSPAWTGAGAVETARNGPRTRRAASFAYRSNGGQLDVKTIGGTEDQRRGLIREALLVSQAFPGVGMRHRLSLRIAGGWGQAIALKMPGNAVVDRVRRDGQPVIARQLGDRFEVEIPDSSGTRIDSTVTLDYRTDADLLGAGPIEPARLLPEASLPCLSFVWDVITPEPWVLADEIHELVATDPKVAHSTTARLLGFHNDLWSRPDRAGQSSVPAAASILAELDRLASEQSDAADTLGEWLVKLDSGRWPVVIDRLALRSSGWGPGSRAARASVEAKSPASVNGFLEPLGLVAMPMGGVVLITSRLEAPENPSERQSWSAALKGVPAQGRDATDRFQSPARWRGEATPRALAASESLDRLPGPVGWHCRRLATIGWPSLNASVRLVDSRADQAWGWLVAAIGLASGILARKLPTRLRAGLLAGSGVAVSVVLAVTWPDPPTWASGLLRGFLAVASLWVGRSFRPWPSPETDPNGEGSTTNRRSSLLGRAGISALVILAVFGTLAIGSAGMFDPEPPILALLVFDGTPDATAKPDRVILSLKDEARLRKLGTPEIPSRPNQLSLKGASHVVRRTEATLAQVCSDYLVDESSASPDQPLEWSMPVGEARDLSALVDGKEAPLRISADGSTASVSLTDPDPHQITFRRSLPLHDFGGGGKRLTVPVNRAAFARVEVDAEPDRPRFEIAANAGPIATIDIRWPPQDRPVVSGFSGPVEATMLWDARPVGDLIRLRMVHSDPEGARAIRLALEPGLIVRGHSIPNLVGIRQEGTAERPEWVAHVDPPLARDVSIEVDLWRPVEPGSGTRRWPLIEVMATGKVNCLLGFRRMPDWSGRLEPGAGAESVPEAGFVKSWGPFDDPVLTLAGVVRFSHPPTFLLTSSPLPLVRSIQTREQLELVPGRMNVKIDATLTDRQATSFDLELGLPSELRLIRVDALGLVDWQKPARDRLRFQFDGSKVAQRRIQIEGYLPVPSDSVMSEARSYQAAIPWPRWSDVEVSSGSLSVNSSTRFLFEPADGVLAIPASGTVDPDTPYRASFRVDRPAGLTPLRWFAPAARQSVSVQSELTVDPKSVHWTAVVVCDIAGGPADSLQWNIPSDWARQATLEIEGHPHRLVAEPKGVKGEITQWTILPESSLWGRVKLILRSKRPVEPGVLFAYPEIAPRAAAGRGTVARYEVATANLSSRELKLEGIKGLEELDRTKFHADDSLGLLDAVDHAYQVTGGRWSMGVRVGRSDEPRNSGDEAQPTKVALAMLDVTIGQNGEIWGRARYDLEQDPGPFLGFIHSESAEIPWAVVDGLVRPVVRESPGRWLVPLGDGPARRIHLLWHRPARKEQASTTESLELPMLASRKVPTLISIFAPDSLSPSPSGESFSKLDRTSWELEIAEMMAPSLLEAIGDPNRNSPADRERLVGDLIDLELRARTLTRQPRVSSSAIERIRGVLANLKEMSEGVGIEDIFQEAEARVGLMSGFTDPSKLNSEEPAEMLRVRRLGAASYFRWRDDGASKDLSFSIVEKSVVATASGLERWGFVGLGGLVSAAFARWISRPHQRLRRRYRWLAILGLGIALAWEPLGIAGVIGLLTLGRQAD